MIVFDIWLNSAENSCRTVPAERRDTQQRVYEILTDRPFDQAHEAAEDAASWTDFAYPGEVYETDDFTISCREE